MDIAIEKINKLLMQQQIWKKRVEQEKINYRNSLEEKEQLSLELNNLLNCHYELETKRNKIILTNQQIKTKEKQAKIRFWATVVTLNFFLSVALLTVGKPIATLFIIAATNLILDPNIAIFSGLEDCKLEKEFLKNNSIKDVQQEIDESRKKISLQKEKIKINNKKIKKGKDNILQIENFIQIYEERIKEIDDIRKAVIDKFLTENQELDNLINNSYSDYENRNKLIKKK